MKNYITKVILTNAIRRTIFFISEFPREEEWCGNAIKLERRRFVVKSTFSQNGKKTIRTYIIILNHETYPGTKLIMTRVVLKEH